MLNEAKITVKAIYSLAEAENVYVIILFYICLDSH